MNKINIALAPFLRSCPSVVTLGIRPCFIDYSNEEMDLIRSAHRIFFPSIRFVDVFQAAGKPTFPHPWTYRYQRSRVMQHIVFKYLALPHPRSRIYFGKQKREIPADFMLPCLVMGPRVKSGNVHRIHTNDDLDANASKYNPVIVQEFVEWDERFRLVCVNFECIAAFRCDPVHDGYNSFVSIESNHGTAKMLIAATLPWLQQVRLDDILIEWGRAAGSWQLIQMKRPPLKWQACDGVANRHVHICRLIDLGQL